VIIVKNGIKMQYAGLGSIPNIYKKTGFIFRITSFVFTINTPIKQKFTESHNQVES
jgi:hypothetical protein